MAARTPRPDTAASMHSTALCRSAGVTRGQLRIYEREGLLQAPPRTAGGYRSWPADAPARLTAIRQLKEVGFTLREIALLLAERDRGRMSPARVARLAHEQLVVIETRIARLQVVREYVAAVAQGDRSLLDDPDCGFLVRFLAADAAAQPAQPAPAAPAAPATSATTGPRPAATPAVPRRRAQPVRG